MLDLVDRLLEKRRRRAAERKRHKALYLQTHKRGFLLAAARDGRAMRKLRKLIAKARRLQKGTLAGVRIHSTTTGRPHYGGTADLMGQFITPFMKLRGLYAGSKKRTPQRNAEIGGAENSDHLTTNVTTFAVDFPTFSGEDDARALAAAFGWTDWFPNSFASRQVSVDGCLFDLQILWGVGIDHGDHVHVGVQLLAGRS